MKFKGKKDWRVLEHLDREGDDILVTVARDLKDPRVYVTTSGCIALGVKDARRLANAILKELDR